MALPKPRYTLPETSSYPTWEAKAATEADMRWIAPRLTAGAIDEIAATSKFQPISALLMDLPNKTVISDNRRPNQPDAILYVLPDEGKPTAGFWCATTERLAESEWLWSFGAYATSIIDHFNSLHPTLHCAVDARNLRHVELVERLGFKLFASVPQFGLKDLPFHFFKRSVAPCAIH